MAQQRRAYRVAESIKEILASAFPELADPRFNLVTITSVMLSSDLRYAKVYWTVVSEEFKKTEIAEAFVVATGFFRKIIGKKLKIRNIPELRFFFDDTMETALQVEKLIRSVSSEKEQE